jgi:putative nucleotidyltransferase with HDIG domain
VASFKEAIESNKPFDLITLDVSMPGMDGTDVLYEIRGMEKRLKITKENRIKVMMVTSQSDKDTIITCVQAGCDSYIVKPFDKVIMINKLEQLGFDIAHEEEMSQSAVHSIVMDTVQRFQKKTIELPVLSRIVQEIQELMKKPDSTIEELAKVIEKDAVISVKLIATANSPFYRGTEKILNVRAAIPRIGLKESQRVVSAIANKDLYKTKDKQLQDLMERLWYHSLATAYCAKEISKKIGFGDSEQLFLMGLLHDIGKVLLLKTLGENSPQEGKFDKADIIESIQEVHASFGAALLEQWGFSKEFVKMARIHEWSNYDEKTEKEILIINVANNMSRKMGYSFFDDDEIDLENLEAIRMLEINNDIYSSISEGAEKIMQDSASAI